MTVTFIEDWYAAQQLDRLCALALTTRALDGIAVEIGVWEGRSALRLAEVIAPRPLHCVDTWRGNLGEGVTHPTVAALAQRDVLGTFRANVAAAKADNIAVHVMDGDAYLNALPDDCIRFLHLDASHDYASVCGNILAAKPKLQPGAVFCGDDYSYPDVMRACADTLGRVQAVGNLWWWKVPV